MRKPFDQSSNIDNALLPVGINRQDSGTIINIIIFLHKLNNCILFVYRILSKSFIMSDTLHVVCDAASTETSAPEAAPTCIASEVLFLHSSLPKFWKYSIIDCVDSLGYSEHSGVIDSVIAPTIAEI